MAKPDVDRRALDKIADWVAPDEDGCWCDADGILENIAEIVLATGRKIENW